MPIVWEKGICIRILAEIYKQEAPELEAWHPIPGRGGLSPFCQTGKTGSGFQGVLPKYEKIKKRDCKTDSAVL